MNKSEIKDDISSRIINLYRVNLQNSNELKICETIRYKIDLKPIESILNELYEEFPNEEEYIRSIQEQYLGDPMTLTEKIKYYTDLSSLNYNIKDIGELVNKYKKQFPEYNKMEIKGVIMQDYKNRTKEI